jgi:hypothetical protein
VRIRLAIPDQVVGPETLEPALEAVTRANEALIRAGSSPTVDELLRRGVKWKPEPPWGHEAFDLGSTMAQRGWGDCDDWGPISAATDRVTGRDPYARVVAIRSGPRMWHAVVQHSDGSLEDPSKRAGMPAKRGANAAIVGMMGNSACVGLRLFDHAWHARADLPWQGSTAAVSGSAVSSHPIEAMHRAIQHAALVGRTSGVCTGSDVLRMLALDGLCAGQNASDLRRAMQGHGLRDQDLPEEAADRVMHATVGFFPGQLNPHPYDTGAATTKETPTHMVTDPNDGPASNPGAPTVQVETLDKGPFILVRW